MIMFWAVVSGLTAIALIAVLRPLLDKRREQALAAADYDIEVYKSQLEEVERDAARAQLSPEEADAARAEIGRRLLDADRRRKAAGAGIAGASGTGTAGGGAPARLTPYAVAMALPAAAFGLYLYLGVPGAPDRPLAERDLERERAALAQGGGAQAGAQNQSLADAAEGLARRLQQNPQDPAGWTLLGRTQMARGAYDSAVEAFETALEQAAPENRPALKSELGEALTMAADGVVTARAQALFEEAKSLDPQDLRAEYYLAEADLQAGRAERAMERWIAMAEAIPRDAPYLPAINQRARAAAEQIDRDIEDRLPTPEVAQRTADGAPGPTREQVEAAEAMSPEERQAMIEGMVEGLAARLERQPMDLDGWDRLIRSYAALDRRSDAQAALDRALTVFEAAPVPRARLAELGRGLDLKVPEALAGTRGPSEEDVAAAQAMSEDERRAMIEGMVEGLAADLEQNPDNPQGWTMLARSYRVLDRMEEALAAIERARVLEPESVDLLIEEARIRRAMAGEAQTPETVALMEKVAALDPDNVEANWFLGLDALKAGDRAAGEAHLRRAAASLPEGSDQREQLSREIERLLAD
ncbi:MAG: c-type cytochrome biogenesis protein CcmI [Marivibrio sp.]|uniref:c-type cytochrome biogenesis protein CcmI n=1 Tax=Marivibrio sp. TaxID=2039719 RepID=UPI0032ECA7EA